ncbi:MAG: metalloendopeptidase, partial [Erythrobacteraceae bacterium]
MSRSATLSALAAATVCAALFAALPVTRAAPAALLIEPDEAGAQLARASRESRRAQSRAARLTREAEAATEAATRTAREAAALAARIQQAEADIEVARARHALVRGERAALTARLAEKQEPTARLAAALQTAARRPLALSALQPGSLKEVVYVRAVLDSAVPQIRARTAGLRAELDRGRALESDAARALAEMQDSEQSLRTRRA